MLHFEGEKALGRPLPEVWAKLTDARFLVECVPGVEALKRAEPAVAEWTLRPGFTFVRGTLDVTLHITETMPETSARLTVLSKGIGSSADVEAALQFTPAGEGT